MYGIPSQIVAVIKHFYANFSCSVGNSDLSSLIKSLVRQGCVMSGLLFNVVIDWVLCRTTEGRRRGIRWSLTSVLEDLDYADDIVLLSHSSGDMQDKTDRLNIFAQQVGLNISTRKTEMMAVNTTTPVPITVGQHQLTATQSFTYLGSKVCHDGGANLDIKQRISKARAAFIQLRPVWRCGKYSRPTKVKIYQSCVLSVLHYGSECWRMTVADVKKLQTFHTTCLRKIARIFWPRKISNADLLKLTRQEDISITLVRRRWQWIGHILRGNTHGIARVAVHLSPEGKRKRGRPKITWRRTVESELKLLNLNWGEAAKLAKDRYRWRELVSALCATRREGL